MYTNSNNRLWVFGAVLLVVAVALMGWFMGISPKLDAASAADHQRASVDARNLAQQQKVVKVQEQFKKLPELKNQLAALRAAVPAQDEFSSFLGELHTLEQTNQVVVSSFIANKAQPYLPVKTTGAPIADISNPLVTAKNFVAIPVVVTVTGEQPNIMGFVGGLQNGTRLFLVTTFTLAKDAATGQQTGSISGFVYVLLDAPAAPEKSPGPSPTQPAEAAPAAKG